MKKVTTLLLFIAVAFTAQSQQIKLIKDITSFGESKPVFMASFPNGKTLFMAEKSGKTSLYESDGTAAGTKILHNDGASYSWGVFANGKLYYAGESAAHGREPWVTDGTSAGTMMLSDTDPNGNAMSTYGSMVSYKSRVYFRAGPYWSNGELWSTDGTKAGTTQFDELNTNGASFPHKLIVANGKLYFIATHDTAGRELWVSDGTKAGTHIVADLYPGADSGAYAGTMPVVYKNKLYFVGRESAAIGYELYSTDGTAAGTKLVKDISTGNGNSSWLQSFYVANNKLFFSARTAAHGQELWVSDGTEAGSKMVKDINVGTGHSWPSWLGEINGKMIFIATTATHGQELWITDGTEAGTKMIKDNNVGSGHGASNAHSQNATRVGNLITSWQHNDVIYFRGNDGTHGIELWRTDGTEAGTYMIEDLAKTPNVAANSDISRIYVDGNKIWLSMTDGVTGSEPYLYQMPPQSINSIAKSNVTKVYPNPSNGTFIVALGNNSFKFGYLQIVDMMGRIVYDQSMPTSQKMVNITLDNSPAGIYKVKVVLDNRVETHTLSIAK